MSRNFCGIEAGKLKVSNTGTIHQTSMCHTTCLTVYEAVCVPACSWCELSNIDTCHHISQYYTFLYTCQAVCIQAGSWYQAIKHLHVSTQFPILRVSDSCCTRVKLFVSHQAAGTKPVLSPHLSQLCLSPCLTLPKQLGPSSESVISDSVLVLVMSIQWSPPWAWLPGYS